MNHTFSRQRYSYRIAKGRLVVMTRNELLQKYSTTEVELGNAYEAGCNQDTHKEEYYNIYNEYEKSKKQFYSELEQFFYLQGMLQYRIKHKSYDDIMKNFIKEQYVDYYFNRLIKKEVSVIDDVLCNHVWDHRMVQSILYSVISKYAHSIYRDEDYETKRTIIINDLYLGFKNILEMWYKNRDSNLHKYITSSFINRIKRIQREQCSKKNRSIEYYDTLDTITNYSYNIDYENVIDILPMIPVLKVLKKGYTWKESLSIRIYDIYEEMSKDNDMGFWDFCNTYNLNYCSLYNKNRAILFKEMKS